MKARGIRNDNPLNIRRTKDRWTGMRERQTDKTFVQFTARVYGYRAAFVLLRGYIGRAQTPSDESSPGGHPRATGTTRRPTSAM